MVSYLVKLLITTLFSFFVIFSYYGKSYHIESFDGGYTPYLISVFIVYLVYRCFYYVLGYKRVVFTPLKIFLYFLLHLFILSIFLFTLYENQSLSGGFILFFKILGYSFFPIIIVLSSLAFGKKVLGYFLSFERYGKIFEFLVSLGVGFSLFLFFLDVFGLLGLYNIYVVFLILVLFWIVSYREFLAVLKGIFGYKMSFNLSEGFYIKLLSTEFLFFISSLVLSINLISIVRPFPVGWDDLGAYMNIPHLLAEGGSLLGFSGMYVWQSFTGIGYMFNSATQAFFLNNVGGFLSFISLVLITGDLLNGGKDNKKTFINIPLLVGTVFVSMPMIIFQQAKDMKLDTSLFFFSIIALYIFYKVILDNGYKEQGIKDIFMSFLRFGGKKLEDNFVLFFIIGFLLGLTFAIKVTSLMLISAVIGVLFFVRFGLSAFLGYLGIYFAVFTKLGLWKYMNVLYPKDDLTLINIFSFSSLLLGVLFLAYAFVKNLRKNKGGNFPLNSLPFIKKGGDYGIKSFFVEFGILFIGMLIALSPWLVKNIVSSFPNLSVGKLISGDAERFIPDYSKIYSDSELEERESSISRGMGSSGTTTNEDFGRYFGYEEGINNYIRLPWNLTLQNNQKQEFTDITYIFLAFIPVLLLFLPFKRRWYAYGILLILFLELIIFFKPESNLIEKDKLVFSNKDVVQTYFQNNNGVLKKDFFGIDIYDIDSDDYLDYDKVHGLIDQYGLSEGEEDYEKLVDDYYEYFKNSFYKELSLKIKEKDEEKEFNDKISLDLGVKFSLKEDDFSYLKELKGNYDNFFIFKSSVESDDPRGLSSMPILKELIKKNGFEKDEEALLKLWKENRTVNQFISDTFATLDLPAGYIWIFIFFLVPLIYFVFTIKRTRVGNLFLVNIVFFTFYTFLWTIAAFGVVWYGIAMYFALLFMVALSMYELSGYDYNESEKDIYIRIFGGVLTFVFISVYFLFSSFPHAFINLGKSGFVDYKIGNVTSEESILSRKDYLRIVYELNISRDSREDFLLSNIELDDLRKVVEDNKIGLEGVISLIDNKLEDETIDFQTRVKLKNSKMNIYKGILNPKDEFKSDVNIYRIGTFLKYYIIDNNKRLLEDSLVSSFDRYIYFEDDTSKTVDNMKKLGLSNLLVDLNAPTIDRDPRHDLTRRYENLLFTFTSDKLELVETDSICLRVALEYYGKSDKTSEDKQDYLNMAGVNFESYPKEGGVVNRGQKLYGCYKYIFDLIERDGIDKNNYSFLLNMEYYVNENGIKQEDFIKLIDSQYKDSSKVLFRIK